MPRTPLLLGAAAAALVAASALPAHASPAATAAPARAQAPTAPAQPDDRATRIQKDLRLKLGGTFAGAYVTGGKVVVATTDAAETAKIRAAGAEPKVVERTERTLASVQGTLNKNSRRAAKSVTAWYVDTDTNTVVVQARSTADARAFVKASGVDADAVRIERSSERPRPLYDLIGGERYWTPSAGCSIAFSVTGGYVTAGHCGDVGETTSGANQVAQGRFSRSSFPGNDYAVVDTNSQWTPTAKVNRWDGTYETVQGATPAPVGTAVCRSGSTTNTRLWCGTIQQLNATVNYAEGTVTGLIRTNICADPGDSGGALITQTGGQAQGITSGGSGTCRDGQGSGDSTYFQPVTEILDIIRPEGRQLVTGSGGPGPQPGYCDSYATKVTGSLTSGANQYQPSGGYTSSTSGTHTACVDGPDGVDFDLYLQKQSSSGTWSTVAQSTSPGPDEKVSYNGTAGTYRLRIHAYSGNGSYTAGYTKP
ncbi:S1 family peptidase [Actinomadura kijaniata]|uniref:S1 family peptidase n=1 Tax=Actinomadura kijaniata TaxID=46161 RepID=UPI00082F8866|nr:S1 family peptidase [Actinomadura kijaniata]